MCHVYIKLNHTFSIVSDIFFFLQLQLRLMFSKLQEVIFRKKFCKKTLKNVILLCVYVCLKEKGTLEYGEIILRKKIS